MTLLVLIIVLYALYAIPSTPAPAADSEACQYFVLSLVAQVETVVDSEVSLLLPRARVDATCITEQQSCQDMWRQKRTR